MEKAEKYRLLERQISALVEGETDTIAKMANIAAVLHETFGFWWTGFYRVVPHSGLDPESPESFWISKNISYLCGPKLLTIIFFT